MNESIGFIITMLKVFNWIFPIIAGLTVLWAIFEVVAGRSRLGTKFIGRIVSFVLLTVVTINITPVLLDVFETTNSTMVAGISWSDSYDNAPQEVKDHIQAIEDFEPSGIGITHEPVEYVSPEYVPSWTPPTELNDSGIGISPALEEIDLGTSFLD